MEALLICESRPKESAPRAAKQQKTAQKRVIREDMIYYHPIGPGFFTASRWAWAGILVAVAPPA
jgi:hypothetical protein